jgi:hypothetical protein
MAQRMEFTAIAVENRARLLTGGMSDLTLNYVSDKAEGSTKGITESVKEALKGLLEALDQLLAPPPRLIPVRVRRR